MVNLPDTKPEMVASEFEGVAEALKGTGHPCDPPLTLWSLLSLTTGLLSPILLPHWPLFLIQLNTIH